VGGLDERFHPVYYVDIDLGMALQAHGFVVLYQPASRIRHHLGASTTDQFKQFLFNRNWLQFVEKWGAALNAYEPSDGDLEAAIERAIARSDAFGRAQMGVITAVGPAAAPRPPFDPILQERRLAERSRTIQKAYMDHLSRPLKELEADRAARLEQINILTDALKKSEADRAARADQYSDRCAEEIGSRPCCPP
jgi:hypothetical protein